MVNFIAEIGGNHEGSFERARRLCELALHTEADCVKFQVYYAERLVNFHSDAERFQHFRRFELSLDEHITLAKMCIEAGKEYLASVWDLESLDSLDSYLSRYKIGSGDLTATPILKGLASRGKPIILSTGLATLDEVGQAISTIRKTNPRYELDGMITLLQCTSMYPIAYSDANLSVIRALGSFRNVHVGYSDHTVGIDALITSVAVGARVLEFHFTDTRDGKEFRDHKVSLTAEEVRLLRINVDNVLSLLGDEKKSPVKSEIDSGHLSSFRRGIFPRRDIEVGEELTDDNLVVLRPRVGICASEYDRLLGRRARYPLKRLQPLDWSMMSDEPT